jgi:hypothetical protein
VYKH